MRAILAVAGVILLTSLVVLGVRGGGDAGDPTAMDTSTETPTDGSTAAGGDSDPADPGEGAGELTPSPTDGATDDDQTDATGDDATEPGDDTTEPDDDTTESDDDATGSTDGDATGSSGDGDDGDSEDVESTGGDRGDDDASGEGSSGAGSGDDGSAADDVDDMPETGVATVVPLAGLALAGLALRLRR